MQDDTRAELLFGALNDHTSLPEDLDDAELSALVDLGAEIEQQGPNLALIQQAGAAFDPRFAHRLRETLLSEHSEATPVPATAAVAPQAARQARGSKPFASRTLAYRAMLLPFLLVALIVTVVNALMHPAPATHLAGTASSRTGTPSIAQVLYARGAVRTQAPASAGPVTVSGGGFGPAATAEATGATHKSVPAPRAFSATAMPTAHARVELGAAGPVPVAAVLPVVFRLPATLPQFPATAAVYSMRYAPPGKAGIARIAGTFPSLKPAGSGRYHGPSGALLTINGLTGQIDYRAGNYRPSTRTRSPLAPERAIRLATAWLKAHDLLPAGVDAGKPRIAFSATTGTVTFGPPASSRLPAAPAQMRITVNLDARGNVVHAHRTWPTETSRRDAPLLGVQAAIDGAKVQAPAPQPSTPAEASGAKPGEPEVVLVSTISLVYAPDGQGPATTVELQPYYRLQGRIASGPGAGQTFTRDVPAVAAEPEQGGAGRSRLPG